ncbi:mitochondrial membrane protein [Mucor velutinosus]|uniref:Mitochondrial membrane protein n=1 Tax=Mucor velutinosus TaxID=708070 RepID=A0AAN7DLY3_9FUNG|nr:mitochondrial membrane protein [Mucor velutinosus]
MDWVRRRDLQSRQNANIEPSCVALNTAKPCSNGDVVDYLASISAQHEQIYTYMCSFRHRENKPYVNLNRNQANDFMALVVLRRTNTDEPLKFANTSLKKQRKKKTSPPPPQRRQLHDQDNNRRTVVAYSDITIRVTIKKHAPVPIKKVQRGIATKVIVIPTDEFCTSVFCCKCPPQKTSTSIL